MRTRLQVLAALLALAAPASIVLAQPPDVPDGIGGGKPEELGLLPLALNEWVKQNGGLTRLTLKMEDATAEEIAEEVRKQTGLNVVAGMNFGQPEPDEDKRPRYSVGATGQPFWQAIREWRRGPSALRLERDWADSTILRLVPDGNIPAQRAEGGAPVAQAAKSARRLEFGLCTLRVTSVQVHRTRRVQIAEDGVDLPQGDQGSLSVQLRADFDPKLVVGVSSFIADVQSADSDQGALTLRPGSPSSMTQWGGEIGYGLSLDMSAPKDEAKGLRSIKGLLRLAVATRVETWEIPLAPRPEETARAQKSFKAEGGDITLRLDRVVRHSDEDEAQGWEMRLVQQSKVAGPQRRFMAKGGHGMSGGGGQTTLDLSSIGRRNEGGPRTGLPAKVIVRMPLEWREVQIPFEFKDLPLP